MVIARTRRMAGAQPADGARSPSVRFAVWARCVALVVVLLLGSAGVADAGDAESGSPQPGRLARLDAFLARETAAGGYLGAVAIVSRDGRPWYAGVHGHRDLARHEPLRDDAIFRIYSMTKTVTSVAVLMLMEEGRLQLDDPVAKFLPAFDAIRVFDGGSADAPRLRAPARPLTLHHLLVHTAGFATGGIGDPAATSLLQRLDLERSPSLHEFADRVARAPLAVDPGSRFRYDGVQTEVLARVVEVVAGQPFDAFLEQRIFKPLAMRDTGFTVPRRDRGRIIDLTRMGDGGRLQRDDGISAREPGVSLRPYASGAGGLYSTAGDYLRFCTMLLDGGTLDGVSILGRKTVEQMMANHLGFLDPPVTEFSPAEGFGLGGSVLLDPALRGRLGSVGQFGWSGSASTYFSIDPKERLVSILLMQHLPNGAANDLPRISTPFYNLVYQSLP